MVSVALVLAGALGVGLAYRGAHAVASTHAAPRQFSVPIAAVSTPGPRASAAVHASAPRPVGRRADRSARPTRSRPSGPSFVPETLRIDHQHVTAPIVALALTDRALVPPRNPRSVGWWIGSSLAGAGTGSTVVVGHVDSAQLGLGALFRLDAVHAGDQITLSNGRAAVRYRVDGLHLYVKTKGLPADLFASSGPPRLVLISCGGTFDRARRSYRSNVVVTATLVG